MKHGRIVRVTPHRGGPQILYVVAEEDRIKATTIIRPVAGQTAKIEIIGRASLKLIEAMSLTEGQYKRADPGPD
jgi:hypothetical protein